MLFANACEVSLIHILDHGFCCTKHSIPSVLWRQLLKVRARTPLFRLLGACLNSPYSSSFNAFKLFSIKLNLLVWNEIVSGRRDDSGRQKSWILILWIFTLRHVKLFLSPRLILLLLIYYIMLIFIKVIVCVWIGLLIFERVNLCFSRVCRLCSF